MKIGVNARFLIHPYTGIGQYTRHIFEAFAQANPEIEIVLIVPRTVPEFDSPNIKVTVVPELPGHKGVSKTIWEQIQVPNAFKKDDIDLAIFPYPANGWMKSNIPSIVIVHDVIPWTLPEYRKGILTRLYQDQAKNAVKKADLVVTVSAFSADEISRLCEVEREKIIIIPNAVAKNFQQKVGPKKRKDILMKYGINPNKKFLLYVGGYDARKNVEMLVRTYLSRIAPYFEIDLVLAGDKIFNHKLYKSYDILRKTSNEAHFKSDKGYLRFSGFIEPQDFPALYQSSYAFINLSLVEGFNIPIMEALTSHVPVIASDIPVHRELFSASAELVNPLSPEDIAKRIIGLSENSCYYESREKSTFQVKFHTWHYAAGKLKEAINKIL